MELRLMVVVPVATRLLLPHKPAASRNPLLDDTALPQGTANGDAAMIDCCGVPSMQGEPVIFQDPKPAVYYDEQEQIERRSTKRKKVSICWPPPECITVEFARKLEDEN